MRATIVMRPKVRCPFKLMRQRMSKMIHKCFPKTGFYSLSEQDLCSPHRFSLLVALLHSQCSSSMNNICLIIRVLCGLGHFRRGPVN